MVKRESEVLSKRKLLLLSICVILFSAKKSLYFLKHPMYATYNFNSRSMLLHELEDFVDEDESDYKTYCKLMDQIRYEIR